MTFHIVRDMMTTHLVTVEPDDTVSHAANLFHQHQFHQQLPHQSPHCGYFIYVKWIRNCSKNLKSYAT